MIKPIHVSIQTAHSIGSSILSEKEIVAYAEESRVNGIGISDHNGLYAAPLFLKYAQAAGIKPILSSSIPVYHPSDYSIQGNLLLYPVSAQGFLNLNQLINKSNHKGPLQSLSFEMVDKHREGLVLLSGGINSLLFKTIRHSVQNKIDFLLETYLETFTRDNLYLNLLSSPKPELFAATNKVTKALSHKQKIKRLVTDKICYSKAAQYEVFDVYKAWFHNSSLAQLKWSTQYGKGYSFAEATQRIQMNFDNAAHEISHTNELAERAWFSYPDRLIQMPTNDIPVVELSQVFLSECLTQLELLFGEFTPEGYVDRVHRELSVLKKLGYLEFVYIVWDLVKFCKSENIPYYIRGSAASSLVLYVLGITIIDPMEYGLFFERFLNDKRKSPPDIDIDIDPIYREDVISYLKSKYGQTHIAGVSVFHKFTEHTAFMAVLNALSYQYDPEIKDFLLKKKNGEEIPSKEMSPKVTRINALAKELEGVVSKQQYHLNGLVLSKFDLELFAPIRYYQNSSLPGINQYLQFDMEALNQLNVIKLDILPVYILQVIAETLASIRKKNQYLSIATFPINDSKIYSFLSEGKTAGIFQLGSEYARKKIVEFQPKSFDELVDFVALIRPGPRRFFDYYVKRKFKQQRIKSQKDEVVDSILRSSLGLPLYQEQIMALAVKYAGLSMGEADTFRIALSKEKEELITPIRSRFISSAIENGKEEQEAGRIFDLFAANARFTFNKAHSVSYARIIAFCAYLRFYHSSEFIAASLNTERKNHLKYEALYNDFVGQGIKFLLPNFLTSANEVRPEGNLIRLGFDHVTSLSQESKKMLAILQKSTNRDFTFLKDALNLDVISSKELFDLESIGFFSGMDNYDIIQHVPGQLYKFILEKQQVSDYLPQGDTEVIQEVDWDPDMPLEPEFPSNYD